jgi:hypothetical protein
MIVLIISVSPFDLNYLVSFRKIFPLVKQDMDLSKKSLKT